MPGPISRRVAGLFLKSPAKGLFRTALMSIAPARVGTAIRLAFSSREERHAPALVRSPTRNPYCS